MSYVSEQLELLKKKNPERAGVHQAATEVLTSLEPVIQANPQYEAAGILGALWSPSARSCSGCPGWTTTARCR